MAFEDFLQPGDGVLDLGANDGAYAQKYAKKVGPSGFVLAVEPDPDTAWKAKERLRELPRVNVLTVAVGSGNATATLHRDKECKRNSLWRANVLDSAETTVCVDTMTLDTLAAYVDARAPLKAIKVDVQGAEMQMIHGGTATLLRTDLTWAVEIWPMGLLNAGSSADDLIDVFETYGWRPIGATWQHYRDAIPNQHGHGAMDVVLRHKDHYSPDCD